LIFFFGQENFSHTINNMLDFFHMNLFFSRAKQ
jgi:hypothetical protein